MLSRLIPCMYLSHCVLGSVGSGLRRYKYSAICFKTLIKKAVLQKYSLLKQVDCKKMFTVPVYGARRQLCSNVRADYNTPAKAKPLARICCQFS